MSIQKRDWFFIILVVAVLGIFIAISGKEKTKLVPNNPAHAIVYATAFKDAPGPDASIFKRAFFKPHKKAAEAFCVPCHQEKGIAFPPKPEHKPTDRCLFCHKLVRS